MRRDARVVIALAGPAAAAADALVLEGVRAPAAVGALVARQPLEGREHRAFRRPGAAAAGHQVLATAEAAAVAAAAAAADPDAHRVVDAGVLAGLAAAEAAGLALDVGEEVLRVALHLVVVFVVGRFVVVRFLRLGEDEGECLGNRCPWPLRGRGAVLLGGPGDRLDLVDQDLGGPVDHDLRGDRIRRPAPPRWRRASRRAGSPGAGPPTRATRAHCPAARLRHPKSPTPAPDDRPDLRRSSWLAPLKHFLNPAAPRGPGP